MKWCDIWDLLQIAQSGNEEAWVSVQRNVSYIRNQCTIPLALVDVLKSSIRVFFVCLFILFCFFNVVAQKVHAD